MYHKAKVNILVSKVAIVGKIAFSVPFALNIQEVRSALGKLKRTGEVASTSTSKYTVISIKNYDLYQAEGKQTGRQRASRGQARGNN